MMSMDIAALGVAPTPPDAAAADPDAAAGESPFAAVLDEATEATNESSEPGPWNSEEDADADEFDDLAALAMTSLLSLPAPVTPTEAIEDNVAGDAAGSADRIATDGADSAPDALIKCEARGRANQADANVEAAEPPALPEVNAKGATASAKESTAVDAAVPEGIDARANGARDLPEGAALGSAAAASADAPRNATASASAAETVEPGAMKAPRGTKVSRAERVQKMAAIRDADTIAQTIAAATAKTANPDVRVPAKENAAQTPAPSSPAARLARALERAAAAFTGDLAAVAQAPGVTHGGSDQSASFGGDGAADRNSRSFAAPRHANGALSFTVAAPGHIDLRTLARAVDTATHALDAPAGTIPERDVVAQLVQSMRVQFRDGIGEAVVKLKPEHLGAVQISLKIENGAIKATVQAEVASVRQWLESQQDALRTGLAEQGLRLERFVVEPDGERQHARDDAQPREERRRQQQRRMSGKDHPVFEVTV